MPNVSKPGSYKVLKEGAETVLRFNWLGFPHSPSIESDPKTMSKVIDAILQVRDIQRIVIAESYEYEYNEEQTKLLIEIANVIDILLRQENVITKYNKVFQAAERFHPGRFAFVQDILINKLREDPVAAYILLSKEIQNMSVNLGTSRMPGYQETFKQYIGILQLIKKYLEKTTLIKKVATELKKVRLGDRYIYQEIFSPQIAPNFTLTRFMIKPPADGELLDQYTVPGGIQVEIYKTPGRIENYYHVIPPEFRLTEEEYTALGLARKIMVSYKPSSTEFTKQTREYFEKVGEDLIGTVASEQHLQIPYEKVKMLAQILSRYTTGLGIIEALLADTKLQDIYMNAPIGEKPIRILHADWEECTTNIIPTKEDAESMAARFRLESGRPLDEAEPILDTSAVVPTGRARVCVITKNLSSKGLAFAFRRHRDRPWTYPLFIENGTISSLAAGLLWFFIDGGRTMLFAGPRSSGKTSILSASLVEIMKKYRIITIEDTLELPVDSYRSMGYNVLSLKVQSAITKLQAEIPADEGIRTALRLGDSCLIVGEVRSKEARALYEAMRVGALSNVVAGTIHGDDPYGVWDRVVNDLGVPSTSFKATDIIVMPAPIRSADGLHRYRRLVTITEVGKNWVEDPLKENGFKELMKYNPKTDSIEPTEILLNGDSEIIKRISSRVRGWGTWDSVWDNIQLRTKVNQTIVDYSKKSGNRELLEAEFVGDANNMFHIYSNEVSKELGSYDSAEIYKRWDNWIKTAIKGKKYH